MEHEELTKRIIACAYSVYNVLGFGFLESVYENSMVVELEKAGLRVESQCPVKVRYQGHVVGDFVADLVVEDAVIVELKSVKQLAKAHEVQLVNYLAATGKSVGLLVNFGEEGVKVRRKVRTLRPGR